VTQEEDGRTIFHLITKRKCTDLPTYGDFTNSLKHMRDWCVEHRVKSVSYPVCSWRGYDVYLCAPPAVVNDCENGNNPRYMTVCSDWGQVTKYSGSWSPNPHYLSREQKAWWNNVSFQRDYSTTLGHFIHITN